MDCTPRVLSIQHNHLLRLSVTSPSSFAHAVKCKYPLLELCCAPGVPTGGKDEPPPPPEVTPTDAINPAQPSLRLSVTLPSGLTHTTKPIPLGKATHALDDAETVVLTQPTLDVRDSLLCKCTTYTV